MQKALVVPLAPVIDNLVADLATALGYEPVMLGSREAPEPALERVTPALLLIAVDHRGTLDAAMLGAAHRAHAIVILFSSVLTLRELRRIAQAHGVGYFVLPNGPHVLATAIAEAQAEMEARHAETDAARVARWARLATHHQARVSWHESISARVAAEIQLASLGRVVAASDREAAQIARIAARDAREQLQTEVGRFVQSLKGNDVSRPELVAVVIGVVQDALDPSLTPQDAVSFKAQVQEWCVAAYESAA